MKSIGLVSIVLLFFGCTALGLAPAKSFDQQLAYGYSTVASIRQSAANALTTGVIKVEDAEQVQKLADQARAGLDVARGASFKGDMTTAVGQLQLANNVLTQLAVFLQSKGVH